VLVLPYPFQIDSDLAYLWGLIAGSAYHHQQGVHIDANQEEKIRSIGAKLGLSFKISKIQRLRHKNGAKRSVYYQKIRVLFPNVLIKFLHCLGYRLDAPTIPPWFDMRQRLAWVEGYLNSPKIQCRIKAQKALIIHIANNNTPLLADLTEVLDSLNISSYICNFQNRTQIIVQKTASLLTLADTFSIRRPKLRALWAILRASNQNPAIRFSIRKFKLTGFQQVLYGLILDQPLQELEYTYFEQTFACSSNEIRLHLYELDRKGLINYYKRENNKEYLIQTTRYLNTVSKILASEKAQLRQLLKYSETNALSFYCENCREIIEYTDAIGESTFRCPHCNSRDLTPVELTRYFYYGHLGSVSHLQNVVEAGVV
jgi:transcription initiation factor IIE alpha subunit